MTRLEDRRTLMAAIAEACVAGARLALACALAGIDLRTFRRWRAEDGQAQADRRPEATRPRPQHALSEAERARMVELANQPRFASTPPARPPRTAGPPSTHVATAPGQVWCWEVTFLPARVAGSLVPPVPHP